MIVVYHGQCIDGFTAAWVAWLKYGDSAQYIPAKYGDPLPHTGGDDVLIVDFSYPRPALEALAQEARSILVLDHHKTAEEALAGLPYAKFDMNRSGAGMAWDELHGGERPGLVNYVEDRDLWHFAHPNSRAVNAVIGGTEQTFAKWDELRARVGEGFWETVAVGSALIQQVDRYVGEMAKQARICEVDGHTVPVVNAPYINTSELVGKLAESATFAVGWYQRSDGKYAYSLRSRGDFDVSALAKKYGGGGHKNAAGFSADTQLF